MNPDFKRSKNGHRRLGKQKESYHDVFRDIKILGITTTRFEDLSFQLRQRESVSTCWAFLLFHVRNMLFGGGGWVVTDTLQLALTTLTSCGKRKGAKMERSPAVQVTEQS